MVFKLSLYIALFIFGVGLLYRISTWFRYTIGIEAGEVSAAARLSAALKGVLLTLFSTRLLTLLRVFVFDVILQVRILKQDVLRWFMHMCLFGGFMLLLLMHGLDRFTMSVFFPDAISTINPFMFLRDLFAAVMLVGVGLAVYRRFLRKGRRPPTSAMDRHALAILAVIVISGIALEGTKIISHSTYQNMVDEYTIRTEEAELRSLEAYWVTKFGVVSPVITGPFDQKTLEEGRILHELNCMQCHSRPQWAFAGYSMAKVLKPIALQLDATHATSILWVVHFLACFFGLAYLPFSKMFHVFAAPLSLMANAVMEKGRSDPANIATRQVMELDACTHCGACTLRCSVGVVFEEIPNVNILPSEKIASIKALIAGRVPSTREFMTIQQGIVLCTNCYRCTGVCPSGINLSDLWFDVREALLKRANPEFLLLSPLSLYRGLNLFSCGNQNGMPVEVAREAIVRVSHPEKLQNPKLALQPEDRGLLASFSSLLESDSYSNCYRCMTCSGACPVVRNYANPQEILGLLPHQIMHSIGLRLWDLIFSSKMLWDCLGCYQCQEHCPQNVCVADVMYRLKSMAIAAAHERLAPHLQERP